MKLNNPARCLATAAVALWLTGCSVPEGTVITDCLDKGTLRPICGMQSPEDIAIVPGGDFLLLSELGDMGAFPGRILLFNVNDESWLPIYPVADAISPTGPQGDPGCTEPPGEAISPHGTHLVKLADGSWRYLVVNHGGREAVELFTVQLPDQGEPALQWEGCVYPADNTLINDVVGTADGDVIFTRMFRPLDFLGELRGIAGFKTGDVWRWNRNDGLKQLPGTGGALTNGIEISADERYIFINQYMDKAIHKYDLVEERLVATADVPHVDNSAWGPDGRLWLTSHKMEMPVYRACTKDHSVTCGMAFDIVALDPDTMDSRVIFSHQGPPMGAATVATAHRGKVYMGSFLGDRLLIAPLGLFR